MNTIFVILVRNYCTYCILELLWSIPVGQDQEGEEAMVVEVVMVVGEEDIDPLTEEIDRMFE